MENQMNNQTNASDGGERRLVAGLDYFGTDLRSAGHYFFVLSETSFNRSSTYFDNLPFNPEGFFGRNVAIGTVIRATIGNYKIIAIAGSCTDKRGGCKSVFWTKEDMFLNRFEFEIKTHPIAQKILEQMPFEIRW